MEYLKFLNHRVTYLIVGISSGILLSSRFEWGNRTRLTSLSPDNSKNVVIKTVNHFDSDSEVEILFGKIREDLKLIVNTRRISHRFGAEQVFWDTNSSSFFVIARRTTIDSSGENFDKLVNGQYVVLFYDLKSKKAYCEDKSVCLPIDSVVEKKFLDLRHKYAQSLSR